MKTEANETYRQISKFKEIILDDEFIGYINTLSDSIKEFYKVSKNVNKNINILFKLAEDELNNSESVINSFLRQQININDISSISGINERLRDILGNLQMNLLSEEKNINFFFEDAKLLFKNMKEKRQQLIMKLKKRSNSAKKTNYSSIFSKSNYNTDVRKTYNEIDKMNKSEVNCNIKNIKNSISFCNNMRLNNPMKEINTSRKSKTVNKLSDNDDYFEKNETDKTDTNDTFKNQNISGSRLIDTKSQTIEIEKLRMLNKKLCMELKKCKSKAYESKNNFDNSFKKGSNVNMILQEKEYIISNLKDEMNNNNKKNMDLMNNFKLEIKRLKEENNKLKQQMEINRQNSNDKGSDKIMTMKINNLLKENKILKNNVEQLRTNTFNACSEYNTNLGLFKKDLNLGLNNNNIIQDKTNEMLKKKISILEKKLNEKLKQNKELNNEVIMLKNKLESELSNLSKKNSELSINLKSKQNECLTLKKDNLNKGKEIENLKVSLSYLKEQQGLTDSPTKNIKEGLNKSTHSMGNEHVNKIIENYKKENEEIKKHNNLYQDKIKFYQQQIRTIKNELYEKDQAIIEMENNNENKIKEMKDNYEKKILEVNSKNKVLEKNFEESQNSNCDLNQEMSNLKEQIVAKDVQILKLKYQIEQLQKQLEELKKQINKDMHNNNKNNSNEHIKKLNEQLEEQQNLNNDLNEELLNVKKDNELLKNKIMSNEKEIMEYKNKGNKNNEDLDVLNKEIDNLKNENMALKSSNEKLTNQLKNVLDNNNINNINSINDNNKDDTIKKQNEEIEGFKQLISKLQKEREKNDDDNNALKRENEKIKNQLIRLSKTLPEEYNELQKQYNELESKYTQKVKNKSSINSTPRKSAVEEQLTKELNLAKKEIDTIKKKNSELIKQLEEKEIKKNCYDNKSEDGNKSNYEEEFDLRKMAKGARDKNRSQDINIDYPGVQAIKEKYRELDFYYNSLETLVKKLLLTIQCNPKNKTYVTEICKIVGFDMETTNKIVTNKNKKMLLGLFTK